MQKCWIFNVIDGKKETVKLSATAMTRAKLKKEWGMQLCCLRNETYVCLVKFSVKEMPKELEQFVKSNQKWQQ